MSERDVSGAAFPRVRQEDRDGNPIVFEESGMSLRDAFAVAAMQGLISAWPTVATDPLKFEVAAAGSYRYADAMLAERAK